MTQLQTNDQLKIFKRHGRERTVLVVMATAGGAMYGHTQQVSLSVVNIPLWSVIPAPASIIFQKAIAEFGDILAKKWRNKQIIVEGMELTPPPLHEASRHMWVLHELCHHLVREGDPVVHRMANDDTDAQGSAVFDVLQGFDPKNPTRQLNDTRLVEAYKNGTFGIGKQVRTTMEQYRAYIKP